MVMSLRFAESLNRFWRPLMIALLCAVVLLRGVLCLR
ncbi:Uncharacterised protein [Shigella sonnei]|nr:Uncharacterised protein [Shigella sonnei]